MIRVATFSLLQAATCPRCWQRPAISSGRQQKKVQTATRPPPNWETRTHSQTHILHNWTQWKRCWPNTYQDLTWGKHLHRCILSSGAYCFKRFERLRAYLKVYIPRLQKKKLVSISTNLIRAGRWLIFLFLKVGKATRDQCVICFHSVDPNPTSQNRYFSLLHPQHSEAITWLLGVKLTSSDDR